MLKSNNIKETTQQQQNYFYIRKDAKIWVENSQPKTYTDDREEPYFLAVVIRADENKKEAEVKYLSSSKAVETVKYEKTMPFINETTINVNDMAAAEDINEVDLLMNLKNRFFNKGIFTNVGSTLIIVNPYQNIEGAFGEDVIQNFLTYHQKQNVHERKEIENPHLYDLTLIAIKNLTEMRMNQAIVISGESGAGKTETAKNAMKCITYYFGKKEEKVSMDGDKPSLENQILGCNPILEAFGNAKTVRNDNSSRFGKYVTINLDIVTGKIEGAQVKTYLLEKSRVCEPAEGERNYHIFYHLLNGASPELLKELFLVRDANAYKFLSVSKCTQVDTINDAKLYEETMDAFKITGFTEAEIKTILKLISACLLLGNLTFIEESEEAKVDYNSPVFANICALLDCDPMLLELALTTNVRVIQGQELKKPLRMADAISYRNVFSKELYNRLFNWIVKKLNKQLAPNINMNDPSKKYIGLLDIFGFECFQVNSLEQLCINFTNEKLQQLYINDIFKAEQNEFIREGLKDYLGNLNFKDNQPVIDLMDKAGSGLFQLLDDMSLTSKDDQTFFNTISKTHQNTNAFKVGKLAKNKFTIIHTAKDVEYTTNGFVIKNLDEVKQTMTDAMLKSENSIIKYIFMNALDEDDYQKEMKILEEEKTNKGMKKDSKYLGAKFRNEIVKLMTELSSCACHYVRCLKPNELKRKEFFVPTFVFQQIRYLGILDTIRVRKDGFPNRKKFRDFFFRFEDVCWFKDKKSVFEYQKISDDSAFQALALMCLDYMAPNRTTDECLIGSTKIFMKQPFNSALEKNRSEKMRKKEEASDMISKFWKGSKKRKIFLDTHKKTKYLQEFYRTKKHYIKTQKMRVCVKKIQAVYRSLMMQRSYKYMIMCIHKLHSVIKSFLVRQRVRKMKIAGAFLVVEVKKFLPRASEARKRRMKHLINKIVERAWGVILKKFEFFAAIKIQSHVRGFLCKIRNWGIVSQGREKRKIYLQEKSTLIVQKNYRGYKVRNAIKMANEAAFLVQGYWKQTKYTALIREMRSRTVILQRNVRIYLIRKHVIDKRLAEYFRDENQSMDKLLFDSSKVLFPNLIQVNDAEASEFFEDMEENDIILSSIKKQQYKAVLPDLDPYGEPKITPFAKILDLDAIIDQNEVYDQLWAKEFGKIFNLNLKTKSPIQLIATGGCHTVATNSKGKLFSWGWNNYGQCGQTFYSTYTNILIPDIKRDKRGNIPNIPVVNYLPAGKPIPVEELCGNIRQVVCGEDHTFILDEGGNAYGFGNNDRGQLGLGNVWEVENPKLISDLKGKVKEIKTSGDLNLALTVENELYVWPYTTFNNTQNCKPLRLFFDKKIIIQNISCGKNFAIILSKQGVLYSFGKSNKKGELGLGDFKPRLVPEPIYALADSGEKVTQVNCGFKHVIAKSSSGKVFTWGNNSDGQLGIGSYQDCPLPALVVLEELYPYRIKIIQVAAGFRASFFLTEYRQIICCGTNGSYSKAKLPVKFEIHHKSPEVSDENSFAVLRILCTWNKSFSLFYTTLGDIRLLSSKLKNKQKLNTILNTLAAKWETDSLDAPFIEPISTYFYSSFMRKGKEEKKVEKKSTTMLKGYLKKMI